MTRVVTHAYFLIECANFVGSKYDCNFMLSIFDGTFSLAEL